MIEQIAAQEEEIGHGGAHDDEDGHWHQGSGGPWFHHNGGHHDDDGHWHQGPQGPHWHQGAHQPPSYTPYGSYGKFVMYGTHLALGRRKLL